MKNINVFISGSEKNAPEGFDSWREKAKEIASNQWDYFRILDPSDHFNYNDKPPQMAVQCVNYFMWLIDRCDVLLVNLDHSDVSVGTGCEVQHAIDTKKPVIGFGQKYETWYEWTWARCEMTFDTLEEAMDYISEHYMYY